MSVIVKKNRKLKIKFNNDDPTRGSCVVRAISTALDMPYRAVLAAFELSGVENIEIEGASTLEIRKVLNVFFKVRRREFIRDGDFFHYISNSSKLSYLELIKKFPKESEKTLILNFENHLSCLINGVVFDSWYDNSSILNKNTKPVGYWIFNTIY